MDRCNALFQTGGIPKLLISQVLDAVESVTGSVRGTVFLLDEFGNRPVLYATAGRRNPEQEIERDVAAVRQIAIADSGVGIIRSVLAKTGAVILEDVFENGAYVSADPAMRLEACIPLVQQGRTIGALNLKCSKGRALEHEDVTMFTTLACQIAMAIQMQNHRSELQPMRQLRGH